MVESSVHTPLLPLPVLMKGEIFFWQFEVVTKINVVTQLIKFIGTPLNKLSGAPVKAEGYTQSPYTLVSSGGAQSLLV